MRFVIVWLCLFAFALCVFACECVGVLLLVVLCVAFVFGVLFAFLLLYVGFGFGVVLCVLCSCVWFMFTCSLCVFVWSCVFVW